MFSSTKCTKRLSDERRREQASASDANIQFLMIPSAMDACARPGSALSVDVMFGNKNKKKRRKSFSVNFPL